jgi:hypothetical protein
MMSIQIRYILFKKYDLNQKTCSRIFEHKNHNIKSYLDFVYLICLKNNIKILNKNIIINIYYKYYFKFIRNYIIAHIYYRDVIN